MALPARRPKQNSAPSLSASPPPINSLPGIAFGLFATVAAGFAASRVLRKKRRAQNLQEHEANVFVEGKDSTSVTPLFAQEGELKAEEKDDYDDTVVLACKLANIAECNIASDLKEVDDKIVHASEKEKLFAHGDTHAGNTTMEVRPSISEDEASMETLQRDIFIDLKTDSKDEEGYHGNEQHDDDGVDGDDDRSLTDEELYPVLINSKLVNFLEEISVSKDIPEVLLHSSNSFSDSVSEGSAQEVTSAPVKPVTAMEDACEASWPTTKPHPVSSTNLILLDFEIDSPQFHTNMSGFEKVFPQKKVGQDEVSFHVNLDDVEDEDNIVLSDEESHISVEGLEVPREEVQGDILVKVTELDEGDIDSARINGKVLSATSCTPDDHIDGDKCSDNSDLSIENKSAIEHVRINGKVISNDSSLANDYGGFDNIITDPSAFKLVEEGTSLEVNITLCQDIAADTTDSEVVEVGSNVNKYSTGCECVLVMKLEESLNDCMGMSIQGGGGMESSGEMDHICDEPLNRDHGSGEDVLGKSVSPLDKQSIPLQESLSLQAEGQENVPFQAGGKCAPFEESVSGLDERNPPLQDPPTFEEQNIPLEESEKRSALLRGPLSPNCEGSLLLEELVLTPNEESLENPSAGVSDTFNIEQMQPCCYLTATDAVSEGSVLNSSREGENELKCQLFSKKDEPFSFQMNDNKEELRSARPSENNEESAKDGNGLIAEAVMAKSKVQEPRSMKDVNGTIFGSEGQAVSSDVSSFASSNQGDLMQPIVDHNAFEAILQAKSKEYAYLPLEIGFLCLLVASISIVLWYLLASRQG